MKIKRVFISFVLSLVMLLTLRPALSSSTTQRAVAAQPDTARPSILSSPVLISDINPGTNSGLLTQFDSTQLITLDGVLYFTGDTDAAGVELWKSDGTAAGTVMVKDIRPGIGNSWPTSFVVLDGVLFFVADDGVHGKEVWKSDGSAAGTVMVRDVNPSGSAEPSQLTTCGEAVFFVANDGTHAYELWKTDGTVGGTVLVSDIDPGGTLVWPYTYEVGLTDVNGTLFFSHYAGSTYDWDLWKSDGTVTGTVLVKDFYWDQLALLAVSDTLFLSAGQSASGGELWKSDGTVSGTVMVKDINPAYGSGSNPSRLTNVAGSLFFVADDGSHSQELWKSDGTVSGTVMVKDINPGGNSFDYFCTNPPCMTAAGSTLFFTANDGTHGAELWKSTGTLTGTTLVKDVNPGGSHIAENITAAGDQVFFVSGTSAGALSISDGTMTGTTFIQTYDSAPTRLTIMGDWLYFAAGDAAHGKELWGLRYAAPDLPVKMYLPLVIK